LHNYAWQNRFKTQARDLDANILAVDEINGRVGHTTSDDYVEISFFAKIRVIGALPDINIIGNLEQHEKLQKYYHMLYYYTQRSLREPSS
jgi:hypothetical protein